VRWSGACSGVGRCRLRLRNATSAVAVFAPISRNRSTMRARGG
jgi:hypothetical protein